MRKVSYLFVLLQCLFMVGVASVHAQEPTITVVSPNGGERLGVGQSYRISWTVNSFSDNVKIEYSTDNGATWIYVGMAGAETGYCFWQVPDTLSESCLVKVSDYADGDPYDVSDSNFTISFMCGDANGNGKITVSDPVYIWNYLFKGGSGPIPLVEAGDVDSIAGVTLNDCAYLIRYLFMGGPRPNCPPFPYVSPEQSDDSLMIGNRKILPGAQHITIPIMLQNVSPTRAISIPLQFDCPTSSITCDSISLTGSRISDWDLKSATIDTSNRTILIGGIRFLQQPMNPGYGLIANAYFTVEPSSDTQFVSIDTTFILPNNNLLLIEDMGQGKSRMLLPWFGEDTTKVEADFVASPTEGCAPHTVNFTNTSHGHIVSLVWNFGDGATSTDFNPSHAYVDTGSFDITLVIHGRATSDTMTKIDYISVPVFCPQADFSAYPTDGRQPLQVTFSDATTGDPPTSWFWDFGDGGSSTLQNPVHTYADTGLYTVKLIVYYGPQADTATKEYYIQVLAESFVGPVTQFGWPILKSENVWMPTLADLDGDGASEVIFGSYFGTYLVGGNGRILDGWPVLTEWSFPGSPAVGDIDQDQELEIIGVTLAGLSGEAEVYVLNKDGSIVSGWPQQMEDGKVSSPALGDLTGDGRIDIIVGCLDGKVYAWEGDGSPVIGWPTSTGSLVISSAALGDIDGDNQLEVIVGSCDSNIYAWNSDGSLLAGWPVLTGGCVSSSPALGDLNNDGQMEIVVGSEDGFVYAVNIDGTALEGWPVSVGSQVYSSPALADVDGDGSLEVIVASSGGAVYVLNGSGSPLPGWPVSGSGYIDLFSSPVVGDVDNDGLLEIVVSVDNHTYAWNSDGSLVTGWPVSYQGGNTRTPALGNIDDDNALEVLVPSSSGVYCWDLGPNTYDSTLLPWPMFRHDRHHTGMYGYNAQENPAPKTTLSWSQNPGYTYDGIFPDTGLSTTLFQFRVVYTDSNNIPPASGYPKVNIDLNGDGDFNDLNEGSFTMGPADVDTTYSNGKIYYYNTTLPVTSTCQYSFSAQNESGLLATGEPTNLKAGPLVLDNAVALDLYIHASDITFSKPNPDEGDTFTVYATVHNNSDSSLSDVSVKFYDGENPLDQKIIPYIPSRGSSQCSTEVSFSTMGFYPIKIVVDEQNSFIEWDESNNWAIRPIKVGDYPIEADIIVDASINSPVYTHTWLNILGNARYYPLEWEKVCGAKVTATIQEISQQYSTYTNNIGNFNLGFWGPNSAGTYNIQVEVTDFTLTGDTTLLLQVVTQDKPDLVVDVSVSGQFIIGKTLTVTTKVSNVGGEPAYNFKTQLQKDGLYLYEEDKTSLLAGESFWLANQTISFSEVGTHCIKAITDVGQSVEEFNEGNNQEDACFYVADTIDLKVDYYDVSVSNTTPDVGDTIRILGKIHNLGSTTVYDVPVRFYVDSLQLGSDVIIPQIGPGEYQQVVSTKTWTVDFNKHLLEVMADPDNILPEKNESNNRGALPIPYDLYPYYRSKCPSCWPYSWPYFFSKGNAFVDLPITIYASVKNRGGFDLLGEVHIQISNDVEGILGVVTVDSIFNHTQNFSSGSIDYPFTKVGTHTVTATVDYDNQYNEWNEASDNIYSATIFVDSLGPDLMIHSDDVNPSDINPDSGDTVHISAEVHNIGQITAESVWVQFLIDDIQLGNLVCIDSIPAGAEGYRTIESTKPWIATCEPQNLHICKVVIDPASLIPELDESNNLTTKSIVACTAPDLTLDSSDIKFSGCYRTKGSTMTISAIVHNLGSAAGEATVTFYEDSAVIGYDTVHVEPGGEDTAGIDHEIQEDSSNICVVISDCMPVEYNEANNQACKILWSFKRGDANHDEKVTVSDVVYLINYLFKGGPAPIPVTEVGDANYDKGVTVSDVVYLINYLFKGGPAPCE